MLCCLWNISSHSRSSHTGPAALSSSILYMIARGMAVVRKRERDRERERERDKERETKRDRQTDRATKRVSSTLNLCRQCKMSTQKLKLFHAKWQ